MLSFLIAFGAFMITILLSYGAVCVTNPSNSTSIDVVPRNYVTLGDIVILGGNKDDLPIPSGITMVLTVSSGFEFNPGVGTITGATPIVSGNISAISMTVTSTTIAITWTDF